MQIKILVADHVKRNIENYFIYLFIYLFIYSFIYLFITSICVPLLDWQNLNQHIYMHYSRCINLQIHKFFGNNMLIQVIGLYKLSRQLLRSFYDYLYCFIEAKEADIVANFLTSMHTAILDCLLHWSSIFYNFLGLQFPKQIWCKCYKKICKH